MVGLPFKLTGIAFALLLFGACAGHGQRANARKPALPPTPASRPRLALQIGHSHTVMAVAFAPDGKTVATGGRDKSAKLWEAATGRLKATLPHGAEVLAVAFAPDGRQLATAGRESQVRVWDAATGQLLRMLNCQSGSVFALAFTPNGDLVTASEGGTARFWDLRSGLLKETRALPTKLPASIQVTPEGTMLLVGYELSTNRQLADQNHVKVWNMQTGRVLTSSAVLNHIDAGFGVPLACLSPNGRIFACITPDGGNHWPAKLFEVQTGRLLGKIDDGVHVHGFSPDSQVLITGRGLFSANDAKPILPMSGVAWSTGVFSSDGKSLAACDWSGAASIINPATGQVKIRLNAAPAHAAAGRRSPDGTTVAAFGADSTLRLWDLPTGQLKTILPFEPNHNDIFGGDFTPPTAFSPDATLLAAGFWDRKVRIWNVRASKLMAVLDGFKPLIGSVAFSPDGTTLAYSGADNTGILYDLRTEKNRAVLHGHTAFIRDFAFSADGSAVVTCSEDNTARTWDLRTGDLKQTLTAHTSGVYSVMLSPDGKLLATVGFDARTCLWDMPGGKLRTTLARAEGPVAFSRDGTMLASNTSGDAGRLWDTATGRVRAVLKGADVVTGIGFSSDGKLVATRTNGNLVRLWDAGTGASVPLTSRRQLDSFPLALREIISFFGPGFARHDPRDGHTIATILPLPATASLGAKPGPDAAGEGNAGNSGEWFVVTPEGYFDGSANAARSILWNINGRLYPAERYIKRFRRPDLVRKALAGEQITAPQITNEDVPASARFVGMKDGQEVTGNSVTIPVEVRSNRQIAQVEILVNGRPIPPQQAKPIEVAAKPIEVAAKGAENPYKLLNRFTYRIPLPLGTSDIHIRATAYDQSDLGSDPVEIALRHDGASPVRANLFVLAVGVSRYKNADGQGFKNLAYPARDAQAIAKRFSSDGNSLYDRVEVKTLTDGEADLAGLRGGLEWLRSRVRPGQVDTVLIYLSGHGFSTSEGRYFFATHEFDPRSPARTGLSGQELRDALGGSLRAKNVFMFVDTCHSGGLRGRNEDLRFEVAKSNVYILASSGAAEYSYEGANWGHGAFTLALLRSLDNPELARDGIIRFNALTFAVPDQVAALMRDAGQNENEQEPCVPMEVRRLREPIASIRK